MNSACAGARPSAKLPVAAYHALCAAKSAKAVGSQAYAQNSTRSSGGIAPRGQLRHSHVGGQRGERGIGQPEPRIRVPQLEPEMDRDASAQNAPSHGSGLQPA